MDWKYCTRLLNGLNSENSQRSPRPRRFDPHDPDVPHLFALVDNLYGLGTIVILGELTDHIHETENIRVLTMAINRVF